MADWTGVARTNYVKFKDLAGLKKVLDLFPIEISDAVCVDGTKCLLSTDEYGGWPTRVCDVETDTDIDFSFEEHVCPYMEDDQVLVTMEAGSERLRYITGHAAAYHSDGRKVELSLNDIYTLAEKAFGVRKGGISAAEY